MDSPTATRLVDLNHAFYTRFGGSFSATRQRLQPGVLRILRGLRGDEPILDLGCGNGELARELARRGHRGPYLGLDFSKPLLQDADPVSATGFSARFLEADLTNPGALQRLVEGMDRPGLVTAFAVLHHIPSQELRLDLLRVVRRVLAGDGLFLHSNWQFLNSEKLRKRILPWSTVSIPEADVDPGDYLLDWRSGGIGMRYVHHFDEDELTDLARQSQFTVVDTFRSDGEPGDLGLYQVWQPA